MLGASTMEYNMWYLVPDFKGTYHSLYKTWVSGSGSSSELVLFGTITDFPLPPIVQVQAKYCDLYFRLARTSTDYLPTLN